MAKRQVRSVYPARSSSPPRSSPGEEGGNEELRTPSKDNLSSRVLSILGAPGGSLLVLRAFLGVTFVFAGLQKLTNRYFFDATVPGILSAAVERIDSYESTTPSPGPGASRLDARGR
jgi:hypothetical protein